MDSTMKNVGLILAAVLLIAAVFLAVPGLNALLSPAAPTPASPQGTITVYFFYGEECPHCHEVIPFVESLRDIYPDVDFQLLEVYHNRANQMVFVSENSRLNNALTGVPVVVVGDTVLTGSLDIPAGLEQAILNQKKK